jgi:putative ABC transport system ATP-binding protein
MSDVDAAPILQTEGLSRVVGDHVLVDNISIAVCRGELLVIIGPSGAGKSSFLRLLNRLDEPTGGRVLLAGQEYTTLPPRELRRQVGMVLQSPFLFPGSVGENISFGPRQRGEELPRERIEWLLEQVGLTGYAQRDVGRLSGGEAQRVSLARTLANRPQVLLLDEPTSALDDLAEREVERLIQNIIAEQNIACLMITHDIPQAARLANRVMAMERGRMKALGPVDEVLYAGSTVKRADSAWPRAGGDSNYSRARGNGAGK